MKKFSISFFALLVCVLQANAIKFKDKNIENGKVLNPIKLSELIEKAEVHGDFILSSDWSDGFASPKGPFANENRSFLDYRIEGHLPLYNLAKQRGRLVTRVTGAAFIDENIGGAFFDDPLIEIPELFWQNDTELGNNDLRFVFGKFANRRFFNKDEINPDPFDIGEMRFGGAIANTLGLLSHINEFRDDDIKGLGTRLATGSYGFNFGVKNRDTNGGLLKRWGLEQAFAVSQLDNFGDNFYGITEINKDWGKDRPGRLEAGFLYANKSVFRLANNSQNSYLVYSSLAQKLTNRLKFYLRYGTLFRDLDSGLNNNNEYRAGFYYKWSKRFSTHHWLGYFDGERTLGEDYNRFHWVNVFTYKFTNNFATSFATVFRFNQFNTAATGEEDNNYTIALQLRYSI